MKLFIGILLAVLLLGGGFVVYKIVWSKAETPQKAETLQKTETPQKAEGSQEAEAPQVEQTQPHNLYYLLFDQSISPEGNDQAEWRKVGRQIVDSLAGGDGIVILGIHDQSQNSGLMYQGEMPVLPEDYTYDEDTATKAKWTEVRKEAGEAIESALNPSKRAEWTDIFGALNRVRHGKNQVTHIFMFSDMKESTPALDLERTRLTEENLISSLNAAVGKYDWQNDQLRGARVHCLLDSIQLGGGKKSLNDRTIQRRFWETFFQPFKAELITFDTNLSPIQLGGTGHEDNKDSQT